MNASANTLVEGSAVRVRLAPRRSDFNPFVDAFSQCLQSSGFTTEEFRWSLRDLAASEIVVLHWPDEFFKRLGPKGTAKTVAKLCAMRAAKRLCGTKFIWVAHNVSPHDAQACAEWIVRSFLTGLDGVVFLSEYSVQLVREVYPIVSETPYVVIAHGDYRSAQSLPTTPFRLAGASRRLSFVGQIRPYKNLETLIDAVKGAGPDVELAVLGVSFDLELEARLRDLAHDASRIKLDIRHRAVGSKELEATIDASDAVALPYAKVTNSGSALLALSRNRPVLVPDLGTFRELRRSVGDEWVYLYTGELSPAVLHAFGEWLEQTPRAKSAPLENHSWETIGASLRTFLLELARSPRQRGVPVEESHTR